MSKNKIKDEISIITCSYNKPEYVQEAIDSVLNQTYGNFEYLILENSTDRITRKIVTKNNDKRIAIISIDIPPKISDYCYPESYLKNLFTPYASGEYIMYLADDDILDPDCFMEHINEFKKNPHEQVNYHGFRIVYTDKKLPDEIRSATNTCGLNTRRRPHCKVDGGAVMFRKELFFETIKRSGRAFSMKWQDAHVSDGLFLNKLGQITTFYPIDKILHTKRVTPISSHTQVNKNGKISTLRLNEYIHKMQPI